MRYSTLTCATYLSHDLERSSSLLARGCVDCLDLGRDDTAQRPSTAAAIQDMLRCIGRRGTVHGARGQQHPGINGKQNRVAYRRLRTLRGVLAGDASEL